MISSKIDWLGKNINQVFLCNSDSKLNNYVSQTKYQNPAINIEKIITQYIQNIYEHDFIYALKHLVLILVCCELEWSIQYILDSFWQHLKLSFFCEP